MNKFIKISILASALAPFSASAQYLTGSAGILISIQQIVSNQLIPIAFTLALLYFFWGVAQYIRAEGQGKEDGRRIMVWGVVALFVISSIWGLVTFLRGELLGGNDVNTIDYPTINNLPQ